MVWVKCHEELTKGAKRGIPRALRFILLELSLAARPRRGLVPLPLGMGDVDGVHDLLGGNRREIAAAIELFTSGEEPVLVFEGSEGARVLRIPSWAKWNAGAEPNGASTRRVTAHRQRVRNGDETIVTDASNGQVTTVLQEIRSDQIRSPQTPRGGGLFSAAPPGAGSEPLGVDGAPLRAYPAEPPPPRRTPKEPSA